MDNAAAALRIGAPLSGEPQPVLQWIEVASHLQIPSFHVIGLPSPEVAEARERVRAAIEACGLDFPRRRVVLNLSPAAIRKRGTGIDLAMALAILHESYGVAPTEGLSPVVAWGELGLDGTVKPVGQLTRAVYSAWEGGAGLLIVARAELETARERLDWIARSGLLPGKGPRLAGAATLQEAWEALRDPGGYRGPAPSADGRRARLARETPAPDLLALPRAMERIIGAAAAGGHHLLLLGPRGTGKSQALEWLAALQPPISAATQVRHALLEELGAPAAAPRVATTPVRRIGAQARPAALLGGATAAAIRPGEFSLAHGGLLVADEFPEWARDSREALREPLERGAVTLTRAQRAVELPARFTLAANGNLCPCGGWPQEIPRPVELRNRQIPKCTCGDAARRAYLARLSGPVLDRIDIVVVVAGLEASSPGLRVAGAADGKGRSCPGAQLEALRERVVETEARAIGAWGAPPGRLSASDLEALLDPRPRWRAQLDPERFTSYRARHKLLRVALTLAAWDGADEPGLEHFGEASFYRAERFGLA